MEGLKLKPMYPSYKRVLMTIAKRNKVDFTKTEERDVSLRKEVSGKSVKTRLPYLNKRWVRLKECPHCDRPLEVVIDETHDGRNIYLRIPKR